MKTFGEYIKSLRSRNGMTIKELAFLLDLDTANLSRIENNKRDFDERRLPKLAELFDLNLKELDEEYLTDQLGKKIYETNCSNQLLKVAQEKAEYRRTLSKKLKIEEAS
ncbi:MAG: helix-turn-helix transcriptional regulator [Dysgonamonadaceae bacterium]|nr:helix-turn-helix transcriptional regulator [Dysgonamonadaceae bacterium]MDD4727282.1 helix-turn-helix transcriptional regulator [Dysgonamonadaceae bacterium]